jgi:hypothetical protein
MVPVPGVHVSVVLVPEHWMMAVFPLVAITTGVLTEY